jgi:undecaprenyl diphosphate synthase
MRPVSNKVPKHVGFILDGNRRFAKKLMLKPWKGHEWGADKFEKILDWCHEFGIKELTAYIFSIQNFNRPKQEFDYLMKLVLESAEKVFHDERVDNYGIRINFIGRIHLFPKEVRDVIDKLMERTKHNSNYIVNFAFGYGGREEVIDAVKKISEKIKSGDLDVKDINEEVFSENLYITDEPEMIIRTGGEHRTSNFLIWQSHYSEWFFVDKLWPEFEKEDFVRCLQEYSDRERRFGR